MLQIVPMTSDHWPHVVAIYWEGIATGNATFASAPPDSWVAWDAGKIASCSVVAVRDEQVIGWAAVSPTSTRAVYAGVVEHSVYVAASAIGQGVGSALMDGLIHVTEACGIWMLQSSVFPENIASLRLHARHGFREVGRRERIGLMSHGPWQGQWRDTVFLERRSQAVGL